MSLARPPRPPEQGQAMTQATKMAKNTVTSSEHTSSKEANLYLEYAIIQHNASNGQCSFQLGFTYGV